MLRAIVLNFNAPKSPLLRLNYPKLRHPQLSTSAASGFRGFSTSACLSQDEDNRRKRRFQFGIKIISKRRRADGTYYADTDDKEKKIKDDGKNKQTKEDEKQNEKREDHDDDEKYEKKFETEINLQHVAGFLIGAVLGSTMLITLLNAGRGPQGDDNTPRDQGGIPTNMFQSINKAISWNQFVDEYLSKGKVAAIRAPSLPKEDNLSDALILVRLKPNREFGDRRFHVRVNKDIFFNLDNKIREVEKINNIEPYNYVFVEHVNKQSEINILNLVLAGMVFSFLIGLFRSRISVNMQDFTGGLMKSYKRGDGAMTATRIRFRDIAGNSQAKVEIREYVDYLKRPMKFQKLGAKIPKGALLLGPPGCGKTLLAKAVATESGVPFLVMAGSEFDEVIGGVGAARVRNLFKDARSLKPCIIYIDEIDAVGRKRTGGSGGFEGSGESEHTLNQLLTEMDGMTDNSGVILLASTNRPDVLDKALTRPGRFDRHITIDLPTQSERREIFSMYLNKLSLQEPVDQLTGFVAHATPGMTGADIANICNEAALHAAREKHDYVTNKDLQYALSRVIAGQAKINTTLSSVERKTVAYHECGHVITSWMQEYTNKLLKVSIIPRTKGALGFAQYIPEDKHLHSKDELFQQMVVMLGGRAAEAVMFNRITTGAADDLNKVSELARQQIRTYGMNEKIGLLSFREGDQFQSKPYSKYLQSTIDHESRQLVASAYSTAETILRENRNKLEKLAQLLIEKEEMTYADVKSAIGAPPYGEKEFVML